MVSNMGKSQKASTLSFFFYREILPKTEEKKEHDPIRKRRYN
jgi:hypothetical protein